MIRTCKRRKRPWGPSVVTAFGVMSGSYSAGWFVSAGLVRSPCARWIWRRRDAALPCGGPSQRRWLLRLRPGRSHLLRSRSWRARPPCSRRSWCSRPGRRLSPTGITRGTRVWGGLDLCRDALAADYRYIESDEAHKKLDLATRAFFNDSSMGVEEALRRFFAALGGALGHGGVRGSYRRVCPVAARAARVAHHCLHRGEPLGKREELCRHGRTSSAASEAFEYLSARRSIPQTGRTSASNRMSRVVQARPSLRCSTATWSSGTSSTGPSSGRGYVAAACALVRDGASYATLIWLLFAGSIDLPAFCCLRVWSPDLERGCRPPLTASPSSRSSCAT